MLEERSWITPTLGGAPRFAKPALRLLAHGRDIRGPGSGRDGRAPPVGRRGTPARAGPVRLRPLGPRGGRGVARRARAAPLRRVRRDRPDGAHRRDARALDDRRGLRVPAGLVGCRPARPLVRARLDRRRAGGARQGAGGAPDPARRGGRLPAARGRPRPGVAGGVAAPRAGTLPPGRRTLVRRHVLAPRLGLRRASPGRDPRPRAPARDRAGRHGALLRPGAAPGLLPLERVPAGSRRRGAPAGARAGPERPAGGGDRLRGRLAPRGPGALLGGPDAASPLRPPAVSRGRPPRRGVLAGASLAAVPEPPRRDRRRPWARSWPRRGSRRTSSSASWRPRTPRPPARACPPALCSSRPSSPGAGGDRARAGRRPPLHDARRAERARPRDRLPGRASGIQPRSSWRRPASSRPGRPGPRGRATRSPRSARTGRASSSTRGGPIEFLGPVRATRASRSSATRPGRLFVIAPAALVRTLPRAGALSVLETRGGYVLLASDAASPRMRRVSGRGRLGPVLLVLALGALLYLPGLGREILRHPLEAKYALAAREMVRGGPWLVAHLFGEIYPDKPPALLLGHRGRGRAPGRTARRGVRPAARGPGRAREPRLHAGARRGALRRASGPDRRRWSWPRAASSSGTRGRGTPTSS